MTTYAIGVDIGGTFTDCAVVDDAGRVAHGKVATTPDDRSVGFLESIADAGRSLGLSLDELFARCTSLVHGTTTGTNAIVTRSGARVGVLTTRGHRDTLFMMRGCGRTVGVPADQLMDLIASRAKPVPIVAKDFVQEVTERVDVDGDVVVALDREQAAAAIVALLARGVEAIAIALLWSTQNPTHEHALAEMVRERAPELMVSCSSDIVGRVGEYERTVTTVLNAYIGPLMTRYITRIEEGARAHGFAGAVLFSQCAGGAITAAEARRAPILTVNSGPVAGVSATTTFVREVVDEPDVLHADMGGTTFDVSLLRDHEALVKDTAILERYEAALPMLDVESIGAGGGSIAWIDSVDRLHVGPQSAGAVPGPVCYGRGGTEPTVTDADLVLGILDPGSFVGAVPVDRSAAERAVADLGRRLGLDTYEMAAGITRLIDSKMADLLRRMSEFRGLDPRRLAMVAVGGGGPVHGASCAREAGVARVVVPLPDVVSVWSAGGAATEDIVHVYLHSTLVPLPVTGETLRGLLTPLLDRARAALRDEGFDDGDIRVVPSVQMKYSQQVYSIDVPVDLDVEEDLADRFVRRYAERYGKNAGFTESGIEITALHVRAIGARGGVSLRGANATGTGAMTELRRPVYWWELRDVVDTPVLRIDGSCDLGATVLAGPHLIELPGSVVVVRPGQTATWHDSGSILIDTAPSAAGR